MAGQNKKPASSRELLEPPALSTFERTLLVGKADKLLNTRPDIASVPRSSLLDRARMFLPELAAANSKLQEDLQVPIYNQFPAPRCFASLFVSILSSVGSSFKGFMLKVHRNLGCMMLLFVVGPAAALSFLRTWHCLAGTDARHLLRHLLRSLCSVAQFYRLLFL